MARGSGCKNGTGAATARPRGTHRDPVAALVADAIADGILPASTRVSATNVQRLLIFWPAERLQPSRALRDEIFARDGRRCGLCRRECKPEAKTGCVDHFVPVALGGPSTPDNLWLTCATCNTRKLGRWPDEEAVSAFLATGRQLPPIYFELLAARPWRGWQQVDPAQGWLDEVTSHRRRQWRLQREARRAALRAEPLAPLRAPRAAANDTL